MVTSSSAVTVAVTVFGPEESSVSPVMSTTAPALVGVATTSTDSVP